MPQDEKTVVCTNLLASLEARLKKLCNVGMYTMSLVGLEESKCGASWKLFVAINEDFDKRKSLVLTMKEGDGVNPVSSYVRTQGSPWSTRSFNWKVSQLHISYPHIDQSFSTKTEIWLANFLLDRFFWSSSF